MSASIEEILGEATVLESKYDWLQASRLYEQALKIIIKDFFRKGEIQERIAYCKYRAAYQSDTREDFKELLESTSRDYGRATEFYKMLEGPKKQSRVLTSRTMELFYKSWLIEDPSERRKEVARCVEQSKVALQASEDAEDELRFVKVCNDFLSILYALSELSYAYSESLEIIESALDYGSRSLKALKQGGDGYELARCHYLLSLFIPDRPFDVFDSVERQQELLQLGMGYAETAVESSEKVGDPYLIGLSCGVLTPYLFEVKGDLEAALLMAKRQLEIGEQINDRLILARANEYLSYYLGYLTNLEEDRDKKSIISNKAIDHADEAIFHYKIILNPMLKPILARDQIHHARARSVSEPVSFDISELQKLSNGRCYLFGSQDRCFKALANYSKNEASILAIIRDDPENLMMRYGFNVEEVYVLSSRGLKGYEALPNLQLISRTIIQGLRDGVDVVLLDGLEYLIARSGFESVFAFIQEMRFTFLDMGGILLIPLDLEIIDRRQRALLLSELELIT